MAKLCFCYSLISESDKRGIYIEVPTRKVAPSQTCPSCGVKRKKDLSERIHTCDCGIDPLDRDVAAAIVMLNYARGLGTSLQDVESPSSIPCTKDLSACSMAQLGALKRQKLILSPKTQDE